MEQDLLRLELRYIFEKLRRRISSQYALSKSAWEPRLVDAPPGERFLVLAPHTDDETIGCGGTVMRLLSLGRSVRVVCLSNESVEGGSSAARRAEAEKAMSEIGVTDHLIVQDEFPSADLLRRVISEEMSSGQYDAVFLPSPIENHDHHTATCMAWAEAMRAGPKATTAVLYEIWTPLVPNMLVDITDLMPRKLDAVRAYASQVRSIDYVRAVEGLAGYRAAISGRKGYVEAFLSISSSDLIDLMGL